MEILLHDAELERLGNEFVKNNYARYMTFEDFLTGEHAREHIKNCAQFEPLLLKQKKVQGRVARADVLNKFVMRDGIIFGRTKHHSYKTSIHRVAKS